MLWSHVCVLALIASSLLLANAARIDASAKADALANALLFQENAYGSTMDAYATNLPAESLAKDVPHIDASVLPAESFTRIDRSVSPEFGPARIDGSFGTEVGSARFLNISKMLFMLCLLSLLWATVEQKGLRKMVVSDPVLTAFVFFCLCIEIRFWLMRPSMTSWFSTATLQDVSAYFVVAAFFVNGLSLDTSVLRPLRQVQVLSFTALMVVFAAVCSLCFFSCLPRMDPTLNSSILQGMGLFCVVPPNILPAMAAVQQSDNEKSPAASFALLSTICSLLTLSMIVPNVFVSNLIRITELDIIRGLSGLILFPLAIGMSLASYVVPLRDLVNRSRVSLEMWQSTCLVFVLLLHMRSQMDISGMHGKDLGLCVVFAVAVCLMHQGLVCLVSRFAGGLACRDWTSCASISGQKSLLVCVAVVAVLPKDTCLNSGFVFVPCMLAHVARQLFESMFTA